MPRNTESTLNAKLGQLLCERHPEWILNETVFTECTDVIDGHASARLDLLVHPSGGQPVAIETEFKTGPQVDEEAQQRLGLVVKDRQETIESALSVGLPEDLRYNPDRLDSSVLDFASHQLSTNQTLTRWPTEGWLQGKIDRFADAVEFVSLSDRRVAQGTDLFQKAISGASAMLRSQVPKHVLLEIAGALHQEDSEQTTQMALTIVANALVFHCAIEGQEGVPMLHTLREAEFSASSVFQAWKTILGINYWPIFSIARTILSKIPTSNIPELLSRLNLVAEQLSRMGATTFHDLTGRLFQQLIADRKFLATFYTLPTSAQLLADLAVDRINVDWSDGEAICNLRIADFACGTGALLSAVQRVMYRRYRRTGGNDANIHRAVVENVLIASDIMPAAAHITASMLSSPHPRIAYGKSRVHTLPYGSYNEDAYVSIGALDLLEASVAPSLFNPGAVQMAGHEKATGTQSEMDVPDGLCDLVIMNPPFTRPTNHELANVPVPSFAGFGTSEDEQHKMSIKLKSFRKTLFGSGHAGLASNFLDLAHLKLKPGGVLAMVLPFSFSAGASWKKAREALDKHYDYIRIIGIAATGKVASAFSADTGMAECLLLATKKRNGRGRARVQLSNLTHRPRSMLEASASAEQIWREVDYSDTIDEIGGVAIVHEDVVRTAKLLCRGVLQLPRETVGTPLSIARLGKIADRGVVHREISNARQGAFDVRTPKTGEVATYPILWSHDAKKERTFIVQPDRCGDVRPGRERQAARIWGKSSRLHSNLDFRLNSQSLAMCITPMASIGGTAWPNVTVHNEAHEIPLMLWANSTLGLILFWYRGMRQQQGRSRLTVSRLPDLPVLDVRKLSQDQLRRCKQVYDNICRRPFLPANEAYRDSTRQELDAAICSVLGIEESRLDLLDLLRRQWCSEPSVHGGKSTRPHM